MVTPVFIRYDDGKERKIGTFDGETLVCNRRVKDHLFRNGRHTVEEARADRVSAWGLDCKVCDGLRAKGGKWLVIKVGKEEYRCSLDDMVERGKVLHMKPHRPQYFLKEHEFERLR